MALEAWAHQRVESGESFDNVLADVLGPSDTPAAFLLIAVDLLLSHRPRSRDAAIPFLASPELLWLDRERYIADLPMADPLGLNELLTQSAGAPNTQRLRDRPSRRAELCDLLGRYAVGGPPDLRDRLNALLRQATERLGPPTPQSTLRDPRLMAAHALNLVDPANWPDVVVQHEDGTQTTARKYASPEAERRHFQAFESERRDQAAATNMQVSLAAALKDPASSSSEFAAEAAAWAQKSTPSPADDDAQKLHSEAVITAAMIAMRDGTPELRDREAAWARALFRRTLQTDEEPAQRLRSGLQFNPVAIAFCGMIHCSETAPSRTTCAAFSTQLVAANTPSPMALPPQLPS